MRPPAETAGPILLEAAAARGAEVRFNTEYVSLEQDADGVTATVRHRPSGALSQIRAKYLLGANGSRSQVAADGRVVDTILGTAATRSDAEPSVTSRQPLTIT